MALSSQQVAFMQRLQSSANNLADTIADLRQLEEIYSDRAYSTIADADLADLEVTHAQLEVSSTLLHKLRI